MPNLTYLFANKLFGIDFELRKFVMEEWLAVKPRPLLQNSLALNTCAIILGIDSAEGIKTTK